MRIQHILMAILVFLATMTALSNIAVDLETEWGVSEADLYNGSGNVSAIITLFNYSAFDEQQQITMNSTQMAPGGAGANTPDPTQGQQSATTASSLMMAYQFAAQAWSLPKIIINTMGGFFDIDPIWLTTVIMWLIITVAFILASAIFYNKL